jgi:hypothetical protein
VPLTQLARAGAHSSTVLLIARTWVKVSDKVVWCTCSHVLQFDSSAGIRHVFPRVVNNWQALIQVAGLSSSLHSTCRGGLLCVLVEEAVRSHSIMFRQLWQSCSFLCTPGWHAADGFLLSSCRHSLLGALLWWSLCYGGHSASCFKQLFILAAQVARCRQLLPVNSPGEVQAVSVQVSPGCGQAGSQSVLLQLASAGAIKCPGFGTKRGEMVENQYCPAGVL